MSHKIGMDLGKGHIKYQTATGTGEIPAWLSRGRITQVMGKGSGAGGIRYQEQDYIIGRDAILGKWIFLVGDRNKRRSPESPLCPLCSRLSRG